MKAEEIINKFKRCKKVYRHGDVVILSHKQDKGGHDCKGVLAEGEVTGHAHRVKGNAQVTAEAEDAVHRLMTVAERVLIDHEEHKPKAVPKGTYKIGVQKQWTPEGLRRVED